MIRYLMHNYEYFSYLSTKTYFVSTQMNCLNETGLLSIQNKSFSQNIYAMGAQKNFLNVVGTQKNRLNEHPKQRL